MTALVLSILFFGALLASLAVCSLGEGALRIGRASRFAGAPKDFAPPVSILKPLSGLDPELEENLESFFRLDYPSSSREMVFSFARRDDPAFHVARRVADRHADVRTIFVVDAREPGRNSKVNRLTAALKVARHALVLFSDGDVRVAPDFLRNAVSFFSDSSVGLVSHLFRASGVTSLAARLEARYLDGTLRPGTAALSRVLGRPCVVGKSILVSKPALDSIGGMLSLRDRLAEDFLLGELVRKAGYRVVLSSDEVETRLGSRALRTVWLRHRRWAILRRRLGGRGYAAEALGCPSVLAAGALLASPTCSMAAAAVVLWAARLLLELVSDRRATARDLVWLPIRDLFAAGIFWAGLLGTRTTWRGRRLVVGPGTTLLPDLVTRASGRGAFRGRRPQSVV